MSRKDLEKLVCLFMFSRLDKRRSHLSSSQIFNTGFLLPEYISDFAASFWPVRTSEVVRVRSAFSPSSQNWTWRSCIQLLWTAHLEQTPRKLNLEAMFMSNESNKYIYSSTVLFTALISQQLCLQVTFGINIWSVKIKSSSLKKCCHISNQWISPLKSESVSNICRVLVSQV